MNDQVVQKPVHQDDENFPKEAPVEEVTEEVKEAA